MRTKHFAVTIKTSQKAGMIWLSGFARYGDNLPDEIDENVQGGNAGVNAYIFDGLGIREGVKWDKSQFGKSNFNQSFFAGAGAGQFLGEIRQHLNRLERRIEHLKSELMALRT